MISWLEKPKSHRWTIDSENCSAKSTPCARSSGIRMRGRPNDVDVVLQIVRETVWHRCSSYDPAKGTPDAFVFGITRHVVLRELERKVSADRGRSLAEIHVGSRPSGCADWPPSTPTGG